MPIYVSLSWRYLYPRHYLFILVDPYSTDSDPLHRALKEEPFDPGFKTEHLPNPQLGAASNNITRGAMARHVSFNVVSISVI